MAAAAAARGGCEVVRGEAADLRCLVMLMLMLTLFLMLLMLLLLMLWLLLLMMVTRMMIRCPALKGVPLL